MSGETSGGDGLTPPIPTNASEQTAGTTAEAAQQPSAAPGGNTEQPLTGRRESDQGVTYDVLAAGRLKGYEGWIKSILESESITKEQAQKEIAVAMASLALQRDVSEEEARTASEAARRDVLTGLYNRAELDDQLQRLTSAGKPFGIIMVDLDHFKAFNDTYGHQAGDIALVETALTLGGKIRGGDVLIRYGGEEIVALLPGVEEPERVREIGNSMVEAVGNRQMDIEGRRVGITLSAGGAVFHEGETIDQIIGRADAALYVSKDTGRNRMTLNSST